MNQSGLIAIHPLTLVPNYRVGTNVYIWNQQAASAVKLLSSEQTVTENTFNFLLANPGQKVFVEDTSYHSYQEYLIEHLETWVLEPRIPRILKTTIMTEYFHGQFTAAFSKKTVRSLIETSTACCAKLAKIGRQFQWNGRELQKALRHDSSFVTHAVNTAFYAFLIAEGRGYSEVMTAELCVGAMLHDIGKADLPDNDSTFASESLQDTAQRNGKAHPIMGFQRLCHESDIAETQLLMCYQHHERLDGMGFPVGLVNDEIHEASKICAVANRYDGLTSDRPHRKAISRMAAFRILDSEKNTALDSEVIRCLKAKLSQVSAN